MKKNKIILKTKEIIDDAGGSRARPISEEKTKSSKGITLIALIITIIVMIILVAVTVTVALNEGIFTKAKGAGSKTQKEADRELLQSAVIGTIGENGEVDFTELNKDILAIGYSGVNGIYSKNGNTFIVEKNGKITDKNLESSDEESENKSYSFTLNSLGEWTVDYNDWIEFDANAIWSKIGKNLYNDENYRYDSGQEGNWVFSLNTDNPNILNYFDLVFNGISGDDSTLFILGHVLDDNTNKFLIQVMNNSNEDALTTKEGTNLMTIDDFMETYGDVVLTFVETSSLNS